jgi:hypothetical protein
LPLFVMHARVRADCVAMQHLPLGCGTRAISEAMQVAAVKASAGIATTEGLDMSSARICRSCRAGTQPMSPVTR